MSTARRLIRQEIRAQAPLIVGTTLSNPEYGPFDNAGSPVWTVRGVEIGAENFLANVPVKAVNGSRAYARQGAPVLLRRNAQGRYEVIGPGDRVAGTLHRKRYTFGVAAPVAEFEDGFTHRTEPFEFYQGSGPPNSRWNDGVTPFPKVSIVDALGNIIE